MKRSSMWSTAVGLLLVSGCSAARRQTSLPVQEAPHSQAAPAITVAPRDLCVVLSVGAEQGLSHIGVLLALRERHVPISCVVGTSMGGLVGGFFSYSPDKDVAQAYRELFRRYEIRTRQDVGPLGVGLLFGVGMHDWVRMREVLGEFFGSRRIEGLPVPFRSEYQVAEGSGLRREVVRGGILADEIAASIANPFLFSDIDTVEGTKIDPGADRVSAVPLDAACREFPKHQFLVSNVTGVPAYVPSTSDCDYQEIQIPKTEVDVGRAIRGSEPELRELVFAGYSTVERDVHWETLPEAAKVTSDLQFGRLTVEVRISKKNPKGEAWDALGGAPDPVLDLRVVACEGCDVYGTSAGIERMSEREDVYGWREEFGLLAARPGFTIEVELRDEDLSNHDLVGEGRVALRLNETQIIQGRSFEIRADFRNP